MPIYLDNNASTPLDPRVLQIMLDIQKKYFGNPASVLHSWGWQAEEIVNIAREKVASPLGAPASSIIFTSGATESINLAIQGLRNKSPKRMIASAIEHKAVLDTLRYMETLGFEVVQIGVNNLGELDLDQLESALKTPTLLASIILANNEIGTLQDIKTISQLCQRHNCLLHLDIVQAYSKMVLDFSSTKVDLASFNAHKIYGPKGIGALYIHPDLSGELTPIIWGGGHERGLRSGTLNVPAIAGFGEAAALMVRECEEVTLSIRQLTTRFSKLIRESFPSSCLNGHPAKRVIGNLNIQVPGIDAAQMAGRLAEKVAISTSSACMGAKSSHVLDAIGLSAEEIRSTFRVGIGRFNTPEEIELAAKEISDAINKLS